MNEVYDNNMKLIPLLKFINKYKKVLISLFMSVIAVALYFFISNSINKQNHEEAALIYNEWIAEISNDTPDMSILDEMLNSLLQDYKKTGYTQVALLSKANLDAKNQRFEEALVSFNELINITEGFRGNKIYNKMARVSSARIKLYLDDYDAALNFIQKYSSSSSNAYIHELTGDILLKKGQIKLAEDQYNIASEKYTDQASKSIILMKLANLGE
tara:strand:- start:247 stop:891 length:645 start_codon:yes stop_codon:yes gene_type:complete